MNNEQLTINN